MKIIKVNGFQLAIFKVVQNDALHITILKQGDALYPKDVANNLIVENALIDAYKEAYRKPPISRQEHHIVNQFQNKLIIILK